MAITAEMVKNAEWVAGITLTDDQRKAVAARLTGTQSQVAAVRKLDVGYDVPPALHFTPTPGEPCVHGAARQGRAYRPREGLARPASDADLAFLTARRTGRTRPREEDLFHRTDEALSRAAQEVRPRAPLRRLPHRGPRPQAGRGGRPGDRRRASIAGRCTASRGSRRTSSPTPATRRPGARGTSRSRRSTRRPPSRRGSTTPARSSSPRPRSARWPGATSGSAA